MRKVIAWMGISLDGFIEGPHREIDWHVVDAELHAHFNTELAAMGAFLDGRVTYELMNAFWPTADADPANPPEVVEFARIWRDTPKFVYSTTLDRVEGNTTVVRAVVADEVAALKAQPGGDLVLGGADLTAEFDRLDLIDEYRIYVHPVLIGQGKPCFRERAATTPLVLAETRTFTNGVVLLRYTVSRSPGTPAT